jgi:hypothetical protein
VNCRRLLLPVVLAGLAYAQGENGEGTRQMYYLGTPTAPANKAAPSVKAASSLHLGLRYNVVLLHEKGPSEEIPANRSLQEGDCFAIHLQTNHAGYLYVIARQSSGIWNPLFPSPEIPGQTNQVEAFKKVELPNGGYCFTIHNPAGKETLFVVFSRDKKDFFELYNGVKTKQESGGNPANSVQMADTQRMDSTVERLNEQYGTSRDVSITRIPEPVKKDEPRGAVYVVNTSDKPSSNLVTKIEVLHK